MTSQKDFEPTLDQRQAIVRLIHDWVFFRDNGEWEALRGAFSRQGRMNTNSASMTADEFVAYGAGLRARGVLSHHFMGPSRVRVRGERALVETQAQLLLRNKLRGVEVDITCLLRYLDRVVLEDGEWRILDRQPIYIKDRIDPVHPGEGLEINEALLAEGPEGCRFLIYFSRANGAPPVDLKRATFNTPFADDLYAAGLEWLGGQG